MHCIEHGYMYYLLSIIQCSRRADAKYSSGFPVLSRLSRSHLYFAPDFETLLHSPTHNLCFPWFRRRARVSRQCSSLGFPAMEGFDGWVDFIYPVSACKHPKLSMFLVPPYFPTTSQPKWLRRYPCPYVRMRALIVARTINRLNMNIQKIFCFSVNTRGSCTYSPIMRTTMKLILVCFLLIQWVKCYCKNKARKQTLFLE